MAKTDFCFTYYDGDAARDMAHMNRLERGGYNDIIISQRKFGRLSFERIKKTLGFDFDAIWESIEAILEKDEEGKYYIEWLENSIEKMRKQSEKQSLNGSKGGRPTTKGKTQSKPNQNPNDNQTQTLEKPLGNGNGDGLILNNLNSNEIPVFELQEIYNKSFEELSSLKGLKGLTEKGFTEWKKFVDFIWKNEYHDLFRCKFVRAQDFEKLNFPEEKWQDVVSLLLSTGIKEEHDLLFRIPQFIKYTEKNGHSRHSKGSNSKGGGLSGNAIIKSDQSYNGKL